MGLSIGLLGPLVIESEESGLGKIPKKARALLAYLAAQGAQDETGRQTELRIVAAGCRQDAGSPVDLDIYFLSRLEDV